MKKTMATALLSAAIALPNLSLAADCSGLNAWDSAAVYTGGDQVQHNNNAYQANWWTQGQDPESHSGQWQEWTSLGQCGDSDGENVAPTAKVNGPYSALVGGDITFSSAGSSDSDGTISAYRWSFGDGATSSEANPTHRYSNAGTYTITLTVTDNDGASSTASGAATITAEGDTGSGECAGLPTYIAGTTYAVGDHVVNRVEATDRTIEYVCDIAGWCSSTAAWAYEPGNGAHWDQAWSEVGECGDGGGNQNQKPIANANGPYSGTAGEAIAFSSGGSMDPDGTIESFSWNFGDGATSSQADPSHTYAASGSYTVTLTVTDSEGASATDSTIATVGGDGNPGGPLKHRLLIGYWHNFINGAGYTAFADIDPAWDFINVSFAENAPGGAEGEVAFAPAEESDSSFRAAMRAHQAQGKKVLISLGGANAHIQLNSAQARDNFVRTMGEIIASYGFDGIDIDLEGGSLNMTSGDTVSNPKTPAIVNLIAAVRSLKARFGADFLLTMAPETAYVQGGYANFGGIWGAYLPLIHALRNDLTVLHVQHYNTGTITGADDRVYSPATADFHVALSDMMITGFAAGRDPNNFFPGLRADQVAFGVPATSSAASSGFTSAGVVHQALDCLIKRQNCGSYTPAQARSDFRGLMTWSIDWDRSSGFSFSRPHRAYLNQNP